MEVTITTDNVTIGERLIYSSTIHKQDFEVEVISKTQTSITVKVISDTKYKPMEFIRFERLSKILWK